jgi:hypothetical protein
MKAVGIRKVLMQMKRSLPLPFLVLILAGALLTVSFFAGRRSRARTAQEYPSGTQTVGQERMAALYFRVLSWLCDVAPKGSASSSAAQELSRVSQALQPGHALADQGKVDLSALPAEPAVVGANRVARNSQPILPNLHRGFLPEHFQVLLPEASETF